MNDQNELLKNLFYELFNKNNYSKQDLFDFNVFFFKNLSDKNMGKNYNKNYFEQILSETPTENDDIIKHLLIKSFSRTRNKLFKIRVEDFVDEICDILINLNNENKRLEKLIKKYDAYETKNIIEQNLQYYDKFLKNQEIMKSTCQVVLNKIDDTPKGDYKFSLLAYFINLNNSNDDTKEQMLEYKLNHIIKCQDSLNALNCNDNEYHFYPDFEFFSYEQKNRVIKTDSGTNLLYLSLKVENLEKTYEDIVYSEKKPLLDIFLFNIKSLLNNFKKVKSFDTELSLRNSHYDFKVKLRLDIEFDPCTLLSICTKITDLLQDMISYKVLIDHKWNTIMYYFKDISKEIDDIFKEKEVKKDNCNIY